MTRSNRFKDKTVIVTGAAQGIGKSVALQTAAEGGNVVLVDRSELVKEVFEEAKKSGYKTAYFLADLETFQGCSDTMKFAEETFGKIDLLINNVGGTIWAKPYAYYTEEEIIKEIHRSLFPTLWGCRAVLPYFLKKGRGNIVNISSIATRSINRVPYAAAKGAVNAITASLAFEYASHNIRVNAVATGGTEAPPRKIPRNPKEPSDQEKIWYQQIVDQTVDSTFMKRYGTIQEQVNAILFLASDESSYITGTVLPVGGGDLG
ncbi:1,6-dihydroxycyclohexa-2,4-diene-1-carboxylate dehydrogenase [Chryseobacterium sp. JM1]|uniref:1,6-dihydroxycyclohexa-2,4-diene-1-carboxylate dehydrogenase n=1 Tax=Chryseobacterium sp. JM1 TaxID=1233950 RepID=UPI0004E7045D|nr:1,6-dihydroxycyclohexa-2,4-diene-1-carboxylate dehydrogenase [Chryseobacterium sp. JM1]KFF21350.1 1,6-dihydroxycyclohexa-2,4-diene-1-carboxylate dehydrogenase [Chryseobacterium sp. JM1]